MTSTSGGDRVSGLGLATSTTTSGFGSAALLESLRLAATDAAAGTVGGAACVLVGHPLDTAKVLLQAQASTSHRSGSTLGCLVSLLRTRGVARGWYAGGGAALAANASENALLFMSYGMIKSVTDDAASKAFPGTQRGEQMAAAASACTAATMAAVVASVVLGPIELIKVRLQTGDASGSTLRCAANIVRNEGAAGLLNGFGATVLREVPGNLAFFGVYEASRALLRDRCAAFAAAEPSPGVAYALESGLWSCLGSETSQVLLAGGLGGTAFWVVALPADAIKTQQQAFPMSSSSSTISRAAAEIAATQGMRGFYRGLGAVTLRAFPSNAALFLGVEKTKELLGAL